MNESGLEQRIAAALTNDLPSDEIDALITETEQAIGEAEATADAEREKAFDLTVSPDANAAREAVQSAEFARDRLQAALPRLQARHDDVRAAEYLTQWKAMYEVLRPERDALAAEFGRTYEAIEQKLPDMLSRMATMDAEISRLHLKRPAGVSLHLLGPELMARGLEGFTRETPSIAQNLRLPKFAPDAKLAWPGPKGG